MKPFLDGSEIVAACREIFADKRVLVIGSAPTFKLKARQFDRIACANGSIYLAAQNGLECDLLALSSAVTVDNDVASVVSRQALRGLKTKNLWIFELPHVSINSAVQELNKIGLQYDKLRVVSREVLVTYFEGEVGLTYDYSNASEKVSTGLCAALFAVSGNPSLMALTGFSLKGGHKYINVYTPRANKNGDRRALAFLAKQPSVRALVRDEVAETFGFEVL